MEDQHKKISGYRDLSQSEIDLMNEIKAKGLELEDLINRLQVNQSKLPDTLGDDAQAFRWISIGKTNLQQGLMALTRAVAKPSHF